MHSDTQEFLGSVFDSMPIAVIVQNTSGIVELWSKMAEHIFGWKGSEVMGRRNPLVPADRESEYRAFVDLVLSGRTLAVKSFRRRRDGALIEVSLRMCRLRDRCNTIGTVTLYEAIGEPLIQSIRPLSEHDFKPTRQADVQKALTALTPRELDVVDGVLKGKTTKLIAQNLGTSDQVVRNHLHAIYRQLRVTSRTDLVAALSE